MNKFLALALCAMLAAPAWSAPRTVTLSLPTMDCPVCPITVKKALGKVQGVSRAEVDFGKRQAIVSFDDAKTSAEALTRATNDAGYPSTVVGGAK
jgi:mercuric ion binding protein